MRLKLPRVLDLNLVPPVSDRAPGGFAAVIVAAPAPTLGHRRGEVRVPDDRVPSHHVHVPVHHRVPVIERSDEVARDAPGPQELILAEMLRSGGDVGVQKECVKRARGTSETRRGFGDGARGPRVRSGCGREEAPKRRLLTRLSGEAIGRGRSPGIA